MFNCNFIQTNISNDSAVTSSALYSSLNDNETLDLLIDSNEGMNNDNNDDDQQQSNATAKKNSQKSSGYLTRSKKAVREI